MSDVTGPDHSSPSVEDTDQGLRDIDRVLAEEDPGFAHELEEVKRVDLPTDVEIESALVEEDGFDAGEFQSESPRGLKKWIRKIQTFFYRAAFRAKARLVYRLKEFLFFLKTRPKEWIGYLGVLTKSAFASSKKGASTFRKMSLKKKVLLFAALLGLAVGSDLFVMNMRGVWLPNFNSPILRNLADHASDIRPFDSEKGMVEFYKAFPQDPVMFLFDKIKVNLTRTSDHPNPMGAFEIYAEVDAHQTAVEIEDRQVEFYDLVQRVIEGQTYGNMVSELGKSRLKNLIKDAMNERLTQGWVVDIHFKTFILKP